jgi:hypothetical protein
MITTPDIQSVEKRVNARLAGLEMQFVMTKHFASERLNDVRNVPALTLDELESLFDRVFDQYASAMRALGHGDTFNIRCLRSHINMPCVVEKIAVAGSLVAHKIVILTVMRKQNFRAKDAIEFAVA